MQEMWVWSLDQKDPLEKEIATHSSICAWKSHGQRSLESYSPRGCEVEHDRAHMHGRYIREHSSVWALPEADILAPRPGPTQQSVGSSAPLGCFEHFLQRVTSPCQLVLLGFYLVASSEIYFSVFIVFNLLFVVFVCGKLVTLFWFWRSDPL